MNSSQEAQEFEQAILGYFLVHTSEIENYIQLLEVEDFTNPANQAIFVAIKEIFEENKKLEDTILLYTLKKNKKLDTLVSEWYISSLKTKAALKSNLIPMIQELEEVSKLKKTSQIIQNISRELSKPDVKSIDILDNFEKKMLEVIQNRTFKEFEDIDEISKNVLEDIRKRRLNPQGLTGVETAIGPLDEYTSGLQKGDLIILAARPSMGKTAFALNLAVNVAKNTNGSVVLFSLEMPSSQLVTRMLSMESAVSGSFLKDPSNLSSSNFSKIEVAQKRLAKLKIQIDDQAGITISEIEWKVKRLQKTRGDIKLVIVDYLQLITSNKNSSNDSNNRQLEVSRISRALKQLAREIEAPVIALSQLSRSVEKREDKMPILSDLRESGAIEQDADLIFFLYREQYYNKDKEMNSATGKQDVVLSIAKHRNGATGRFILDFEPSLGLFTEQTTFNKNKYIKGDD